MTAKGSAGATLQGSFSGATGHINETGFEYAKSQSALDGIGNTSTFVYDDASVGSNASGTITYTLGSLDANTTYYYRAFVAEMNAQTGNFEYRYGSILSFTTGSVSSYTPPAWLEIPSATPGDYSGTFYSTGTSGTYANRNYSYNYSSTWFGCLWVAYPLAPAHLTGSASTSSWAYNPSFSQTYQINMTGNSYQTMYNASQYSKGHQIPNADRKSNSTMNSQTYYVTNQTPQLQNSFNGGIWGTLEGDIRSAVSSFGDTVYVVTGACYRKKNGTESVTMLTAAASGANPAILPVPNYYWKALLKVKRDSSGTVTSASSIGFWFEHKAYGSSVSYTSCAVSVNTLEGYLGFDLFTNLPGTESSGIEANAETNSSWTAFTGF